MSDLILANDNADSPFDSIRRFDENGNEFWMARDLMPVLGYERWERVPDVIERAMLSLQNSGNVVSEHFSEETRKTKGRPQQDFKLSRLACYLVAMNGDPRKNAIAQAQSYFAIKTREAETVIPAQVDAIKELELRLQLAQVERDRLIAEKAVLDTRHLIVSTCPEPVQQKILGYEVVKEIEYRDRILDGDRLLNDGSTINKTALCYRYGFLSRAGKPDYRQLNQYLERMPSDAFRLSATIQESHQLQRDFLPMLDRLIDSGESRQLWMGE